MWAVALCVGMTLVAVVTLAPLTVEGRGVPRPIRRAGRAETRTHVARRKARNAALRR